MERSRAPEEANNSTSSGRGQRQKSEACTKECTAARGGGSGLYRDIEM